MKAANEAFESVKKASQAIDAIKNASNVSEAAGKRFTGNNGVSIYKDHINGIRVIVNEKGKVITVTYEK